MAGKSSSTELNAGGGTESNAGVLKRLYDRCMTLISGRYGVWVLFVIAFVESSFFPIPPDVFLIAMCVAAPTRAFRFAAVCAVGSVAGGAFGYGLGLWFMDSVGQQIIAWYGLEHKYDTVQDYYRAYDVWAVAAAGFTPLPYKLFTITAGAFKLNFPTFVLVSLFRDQPDFSWLPHSSGNSGSRCSDISTSISTYFRLSSWYC